MWRDVFGVWYEETFKGLQGTIESCPDELWQASMWEVAKDPARPRAILHDGAPHPLGNEVLSAVWKVAWHGLGANEFNLNGRPADFRTTFTSGSSRAAESVGRGAPEGGEVVPLDPPSREEMLAYLEHNRRLVNQWLDAAREVGDGQSTLGSWSGPTSTLLRMFHGNACHLVGHATEVWMFVQQRR